MPTGTCRLCAKTAELQLSHVIPAFVYRWMRDTSGNGYMRTAMTPNKRAQDGIKRYWLCQACEERFSRTEALFATQAFHPYSSRKRVRFRYGPWLMQFGLSVCWRILHFYKEGNHLGHFPADLLLGLDEAEEVWKRTLLGRCTHPGRFQLHVLPLEAVESVTGGNLPPNTNRYLMRAIDMDVVHGGKTAFVYSKLGRFIFLGFARLDHPNQWVGTKVHATEGLIEPRHYKLPQQLWDYLAHKAKQMATVDKSISLRQREHIERAFLANMDKLADSDQMRALQEDVRLFGEAAVFRVDSEKENR